MRLTIILASSLIFTAALAGEAPERLGDTEFAFNRITVFLDDNGEPSDTRAKVKVDSLDRDKVMLQKWDNKLQMMLIDFGDGTLGWVKKSDLVPPPSVCQNPQTRTAAATLGTNSKTQTLASRGLIEKACN